MHINGKLNMFSTRIF